MYEYIYLNTFINTCINLRLQYLIAAYIQGESDSIKRL